MLKRFFPSYCGAPWRAVVIPHRLAMSTEVGGNFDSQAESGTVTSVAGKPTAGFGVRNQEIVAQAGRPSGLHTRCGTLRRRVGLRTGTRGVTVGPCHLIHDRAPHLCLPSLCPWIAGEVR